MQAEQVISKLKALGLSCVVVPMERLEICGNIGDVEELLAAAGFVIDEIMHAYPPSTECDFMAERPLISPHGTVAETIVCYRELIGKLKYEISKLEEPC